jgi:FdhE protein
MSTTVAEDAATRLEVLRDEHPEWRPWLALLAEAFAAADDRRWGSAVAQLASAHAPGAPLLAGALVALDGRLAADWARRLLETAAAHASDGRLGDVRRLDAVELLEAAANQDEPRVRTLAEQVGAEPAALAATAQVATWPLLQACGRSLGSQQPVSWPRGYCPTCGGWPTLAELRGLERARRLRCVPCGGDWAMEWLRCPFCGVADHRTLGLLVPEQGGESRKVETCDECGGYLKTFSTLAAWPAARLALEDLESVGLDLAALERGFHRPDGSGYPLGLSLQPARARRGALGWLR